MNYNSFGKGMTKTKNKKNRIDVNFEVIFLNDRGAGCLRGFYMGRSAGEVVIVRGIGGFGQLGKDFFA